MNIPTLPTGRNKYYDLGPTRQFDVDVIRRALLQYENTVNAPTTREWVGLRLPGSTNGGETSCL